MDLAGAVGGEVGVGDGLRGHEGDGGGERGGGAVCFGGDDERPGARGGRLGDDGVGAAGPAGAGGDDEEVPCFEQRRAHVAEHVHFAEAQVEEAHGEAADDEALPPHAVEHDLLVARFHDLFHDGHAGVLLVHLRAVEDAVNLRQGLDGHEGQRVLQVLQLQQTCCQSPNSVRHWDSLYAVSAPASCSSLSCIQPHKILKLRVVMDPRSYVLPGSVELFVAGRLTSILHVRKDHEDFWKPHYHLKLVRIGNLLQLTPCRGLPYS